MLLHVFLIFCAIFLFAEMQISKLNSVLEGISDENITEHSNAKNTVYTSTKTSIIPITFTQPTTEAQLTSEEVSTGEICNSNKTCSTTPKPTANNTSVVQYESSSNSKDDVFNSHNSLEYNYELCGCNLQRDYCDINCCCDTDCSYQEKIIFKNCEIEENLYHDTSFCEYTDYFYINRTPYTKQINQNGFFCIAKTNLPATYVKQNIHPISSFEDVERLKLNKLSWRNSERNSNHIEFNITKGYLYESTLWIIRDNRLEEFDLPDKLLTDACSASKKQKYLKSFKAKCIQTIRSSNSISERYFKILFVRTPSLFNVSNLEECPRNICLPVDVKLCNQNGCHNVSLLNGTYPKEIKYTFYHNGTLGLTNVKLLLILGNNSDYEETTEFWQKFEVNYFWYNYVENSSKILSGSPGYLIGKPILMGGIAIANATNQTIPTYTIKRNSSNILDNFLILPQNKNGFCVLNNVSHTIVKFGFNIITKCKIREQIITQNFICKDLQNKIFSYWSISSNYTNLDGKVAGIFGNANNSVLSEWIKIIYNSSPSHIVSNVLQNSSEDSNVIKCQNILTTLKVSIFHSKVAVKNILNQERILAIAFNFTSAKAYNFNLSEGNTFFDSNVRSEVMFYDITMESSINYMEPPTFKISLPYDFFYPFIKISNNANFCSSYYLLFMIVVLCYLF